MPFKLGEFSRGVKEKSEPAERESGAESESNEPEANSPKSTTKENKTEEASEEKLKRSSEKSKSKASESKSEEKIGVNGQEIEDLGSIPQEEESSNSPSKRKKSNAEHICESCKKMGFEDKPATQKVEMSGREVWLCDSCLQAAGYKEGLD